MNVYETFWVEALAYRWDEATNQLTPVQNIDAKILVDAQKNKIMIHANLAMPPLGDVQAEILIDLNGGFALTHVPSLEVCQV